MCRVMPAGGDQADLFAGKTEICSADRGEYRHLIAQAKVAQELGIPKENIFPDLYRRRAGAF